MRAALVAVAAVDALDVRLEVAAARAPEVALCARVALDLLVHCPDVGEEAAAVRGAVVALLALVVVAHLVGHGLGRTDQSMH